MDDVRAKAKVRLIKASAGLDVDIDELMEWYEPDFESINAMTKVIELRVFIVDYIKYWKKPLQQLKNQNG